MRKVLGLLLLLTLLLSLVGSGASASEPPAAHRITVVFKSETLPPDAASIVEQLGGRVIRSFPAIGVMEIEGPASILNALNGHKAIASASPTLIFTVPEMARVALPAADLQSVDPAGADLYQRYQWDIKEVTNDGASWDLGTGSHRTVVGIIDTGVSTQHPDLRANLLGGRNFYPDGSGGTVDPEDIEDKHGHGSHVAGTIAGNGRILGVGPNLGFKAYRVFGAEGGAPSSIIIEAILYAANDGVDVISMSLGGYDVMPKYTWTDPETGETYRFSDIASYTAYKRAIKYAEKKGIVVVAAAGNDATDIGSGPAIIRLLNELYGPYGYSFHGSAKETPGSLPGVVAVSATGPDRTLASYSNYGSGVIDLTAPGGDFQRYPEPDWFLDMCLSAGDGLSYYFMAGTSMAAPKVSAVAALVIDQAKAEGRRLTPSQVIQKLQSTAVDVGKKGTDPYFGKGMVNAYYALGGK